MKSRIVAVTIALVMSISAITANVRWSEAQQGTMSAGEARQAADQATPVMPGAEETPVPGGDFNRSPVMFVENAGQWDDDARYQVWGGPGGTMWLAEDAIWITVVEPGQEKTSRRVDEDTSPRLPPGHHVDSASRLGVAIKMSFVDANLHPQIEPFDRLDTKVSYFLGNDPGQWCPDVPVWGGIRYVDLYPGVDLEITNQEGQLAQHLLAHPGADLAAVRLQVEGVKVMGVEGRTLLLESAVDTLTLPIPRSNFSFVVVGDAESSQASTWTVEPGTGPAAGANAPASQSLTPSDNPADLLYGTFIGGDGGDGGSAITIDGSGRAYVTGTTVSTNFPTTPGTFDPTYNGGEADAFVARLSTIGSALDYATFLGGSNRDFSNSLAADGSGRVYVAGVTESTNFPTTVGAFDRSLNGGIDAFVVRLNATGSGVDFGTYLGGIADDYCFSVAVDQAGRATTAGGTFSENFPTTPGAFDRDFNPDFSVDAFITRLNVDGRLLEYGTFLGGDWSDDYISALALDSSGRIYVTGSTWSIDFPTTPNAFDRSLNDGSDAFVTRFNISGSLLEYSTFLGGNSLDIGHAIAVDAHGRAYIAGETPSRNFPTTPGAYDRTYNGDVSDSFVTRVNPSGSALEFSTFLGGSGPDWAYGIATDDSGQTFVSGMTWSPDFPVTANAFDANNNEYDAFITRVNSTGSSLSYSTFLGGGAWEYEPIALAIDFAGRVYIAGTTVSSDFPTSPGTFDPSYNGAGDVFVTKLAMGGTASGPYNIFGRVVSADGASISGVTITDNAGHTTSTNSNGNYTLAGLAEGNYTLTPSKDGYAFCPRSRSISVPPNRTGQDFSGSPTGTDLGFCPDPNGFGFANKQLWRTWPMFEQYFGPAAVRNADGTICSTAQRYFDQMYRGIANGWSCVGFTLGSLHSFQSRPQPNAGPFAIAPYSRLYDQPESSQLTNPIAYYSGVQLSQQYLNEYQAWLATCGTDPNQMVTRLQQALQTGNPLLLGLNAGSVYHAVTPYRVVTVSSDETHIYVYDSEASGQWRVVRMQHSGSGWQWEYTFTGSLASAGTRTGGCRDMYYYQAITSLEQGAPLVDLCENTRVAVPDGAPAPASTGRMLTVLPAIGDWIIEDTAGHRLGWTGGQWIAEIPNGYALPQTLGDATLSYRSLYLPVGAYTVRASAGASRKIDYSLFIDGRVLEVSGQTSVAGTISEIDVLPGLNAISVTRPADLAFLVIDITHEMPTVSRMAGLTGSTLSGNDDLAISFDGQEMHLSRAGGAVQYRLRFFQPGHSSGYFVTEPITLGADEAHTLIPANWDGLTASTVTLEIDVGRNGTIDETVTLENAVRSIYLPVVPGS